MTIEKKAKAYDEALERAKDCLTNKKFKDIDDTPESLTTYIFPELRESEEETTRKELLDFVKSFWADHKEALPQTSRWVTYLEKQKDHFRDDTKMVEQKPAEWSVEDKSFYDSIICEVIKEGMHPTPEQAKWFKSLPERFNIQPKQKWSEDDEQWLEAIIREYEERLSADKGHAAVIQFKIDFLKSLRSRPKSSDNWKPNEEQMEALKCAIEDIARFSRRGGRQVELENAPFYSALHSLYCNLEKLM